MIVINVFSSNKWEAFLMLYKLVSKVQYFTLIIKNFLIFRDIFSVLGNPPAFHALQEALIEHVNNLSPKPDAIVVLESRGFLLGPLVALHLNIPCIPIRKKGKLPGHINQQEYTLEYGMVIFFFLLSLSHFYFKKKAL